jgi:hypothetical protein
MMGATAIPTSAQIRAGYNAYGWGTHGTAAQLTTPYQPTQTEIDGWAQAFQKGTTWDDFVAALTNTFGAPIGPVPGDPTQPGAAGTGWSVSTLAIVGALAWFVLKRL